MYVIKMSGLYQMPGIDAYYREIGCYCFQFVPNLELATKYDTPESCAQILNDTDYYLEMYNGQTMSIVSV